MLLHLKLGFDLKWSGKYAWAKKNEQVGGAIRKSSMRTVHHDFLNNERPNDLLSREGSYFFSTGADSADGVASVLVAGSSLVSVLKSGSPASNGPLVALIPGASFGAGSAGGAS